MCRSGERPRRLMSGAEALYERLAEDYASSEPGCRRRDELAVSQADAATRSRRQRCRNVLAVVRVPPRLRSLRTHCTLSRGEAGRVGPLCLTRGVRTGLSGGRGDGALGIHASPAAPAARDIRRTPSNARPGITIGRSAHSASPRERVDLRAYSGLLRTPEPTAGLSVPSGRMWLARWVIRTDSLPPKR